MVESHIWKMLAHFFLFSLVTHSLFSIVFLLKTIIDLEMNVSTTCTGSIYLQDDDSIADQHPQGISPSTRSHEDPLESVLPGGPADGPADGRTGGPAMASFVPPPTMRILPLCDRGTSFQESLFYYADLVLRRIESNRSHHSNLSSLFPSFRMPFNSPRCSCHARLASSTYCSDCSAHGICESAHCRKRL